VRACIVHNYGTEWQHRTVLNNLPSLSYRLPPLLRRCLVTLTQIIENSRQTRRLSTCYFTGTAGVLPRSRLLVSQPVLHPGYIGEERKGKEEYLAPFCTKVHTKCSGMDHTQFYLQTTPCLPFLRERSPDGTTIADIQFQLTSPLSTPKG